MKRLAVLIVTLTVLLGCEMAGPSQPATQDLRALIPIEVGEAYDRGGTRIPVSVTNHTGQAQRFIRIECAIRLDGRLIETPFHIWTDVPDGETVTGDLLPETNRADSVDCRPVIPT